MNSKILTLLWQSISKRPALVKSILAGLLLAYTSKYCYVRWIERQQSKTIDSSNGHCPCRQQKKRKLKILCGSSNGKTEKVSRKAFEVLLGETEVTDNFEIEWLRVRNYDPEDELVKDANAETCLVIFMPTYQNGDPPAEAAWFVKWTSEAATDFRFSADTLSSLNFVIFGLGDSAYGDAFGLLARNLTDWLGGLKAKRLDATCLADVSSHRPLEQQLDIWLRSFTKALLRSLRGGCCQTEAEAKEIEAEDEEDEEEEEEEIEEPEVNQNNHGKNAVVDLEDIVPASWSKKNKTKTTISSKATKENGAAAVVKDMITPDLRKELTKQGYMLIGSHSGVKLCRWTKSMLRGRGNVFVGQRALC